jgi:AAA+ superfamily predicted ATPase
MYEEQLINEALRLPSNAIEYHVSQSLSERFPDKALIEGGDGLFNVEEYAEGQLCQLEARATVYNQVMTRWFGRAMDVGPMIWAGIPRMGDPTMQGIRGEKEIVERAKNAWFTVSWQGASFEVLVMNWSDGMNRVYHFWILSDSKEVAQDFLVSVCRWNMEVRGEVLVFDGGCWRKDEELFRAIKDSTFDNLILRGNLKQEIHDDLAQFFAARQTYETYGIPWKRGILFVGPPGNGKTHTVKAIINAMNQPCLYVKSFRDEYRTDDQHNIRQVFERARRSAPCILVLEDLDSLITPQSRSFFLNELDGFASNAGIVTLATTNHPERLDASILDRPSRFDRKYPFDLPGLLERQAYIAMWNNSLQQALRLSEEAITRVAEATEDFSFAYLKELFLSSMMRWIALSQSQSMDTLMAAQIETLREQMVSASAEEAALPAPEAMNALPPGLRRVIPGRVVYRGGPF